MLGDEYEVIISKENADAPNIAIDAEVNGKVKIVLNAFKIYNTMATLEVILVGLNDKVKELIQQYLDKQAFTETELRKQR